MEKEKYNDPQSEDLYVPKPLSPPIYQLFSLPFALLTPELPIAARVDPSPLYCL